MKLTINKLIANDIINYGMDQTDEFSYSVGLDEYLSQYDEESQKYILDNLEEICDDISSNERVADFIFEESDDEKAFNILFYWGYLLNDIEQIISNNAKVLNMKLDFEDIRNIANDFMESNTIKNEMICLIKNYDEELEL